MILDFTTSQVKKGCSSWTGVVCLSSYSPSGTVANVDRYIVGWINESADKYMLNKLLKQKGWFEMVECVKESVDPQVWLCVSK